MTSTVVSAASPVRAYETDHPLSLSALREAAKKLPWGERRPRTQTVAIGAAGSIDTALLDATFAACVPPQAARAAS